METDKIQQVHALSVVSFIFGVVALTHADEPVVDSMCINGTIIAQVGTGESIREAVVSDDGQAVVYTRSAMTGPAPGAADIWLQRLADCELTGPPVRVSSGPTDKGFVDLSGHSLVYGAFDSGVSAQARIMLRDLVSGEASTLPIGPAEVRDLGMSGAKVVWREGGAETASVMLYDLSWSESARPPLRLAGPQPPTFQLNVGDRWATWVQRVDGQYDVYAYDLQSDSEEVLQITDTPGVNEFEPTTAGDWVVYERRDWAKQSSGIDAYNLVAGGRRQITREHAWRPKIDDDLVAYEGKVGDGTAVFLFRLASSETTRVSPASERYTRVHIKGSTLAHVSRREGKETLMVHCLAGELDPRCHD